MKVWTAISTWFQGKKTYLAAGLLVILAMAGWWTARIDETTASMAIVFAFGLIGLGAKGQRLAKLMLDVGAELKAARVEHRPVQLSGAVTSDLAALTADPATADKPNSEAAGK
jgi:hypothetical protein